VRSIRHNVGYINAISLSADGKRAITANTGPSMLQVWDMDKIDPISVPESHDTSVMSVGISLDDKWSVSGANSTIKIWSMDSGTCIKTLTRDYEKLLEGHTSSVQSVSIAEHGRRAASAGIGGELLIWSSGRGERLGKHHGLVNVQLSANGQVALSSDSELLRLWDLIEGKCVESFPEITHPFKMLDDNGTSVIATNSSDDRCLEVWDLRSGDLVRVLTKLNSRIVDIDFSAATRILVSLEKDNTLVIWDISSGEIVKTLTTLTDRIRRVRILSDESILVCLTLDGSIQVICFKTGNLVAAFSAPSRIVSISEVNPSGTFFCGMHDGSVLALRISLLQS
jgi:WD40 repeat protein